MNTKGILGFKPLVASTLLCVSAFVPMFANAASIDLSVSQGFNAVIFNDLTTNGGDTEGRLAVGGDLAVNGSYSVSGCSSPSCVGLPQSAGTRDDLVVGGDITRTQSYGVNWGQNYGNAVVGGSVQQGVNITFTGGNSLSQGVGAAGVASSVNFGQIQTDAISLSGNLASMSQSENVTVASGTHQLILTGNEDVNVFNLTAAQWGGQGKTRNINTKAGSKTIINVYGETINISGGTLLGSVTDIIVNYVEATSVNLDAFAHEASALAVNADLIASGGAIGGLAIFNNADTSNGFEFHNRFDQPAAVPLPAGAPLLLSALAGLGWMRRRRVTA